jgi:uncharacterized membrane protein
MQHIALEPSKRQRYGFIDEARGGAMLMVFVVHFAWIYFADGRHPLQQGTLMFVSQVATPTFMLLSGLLAAFLASLRPESFDRLRWKLLDRGVFMLTIGHLIILLGYIPYAGGLGHAVRYAQITDAIAVAIIVGPWLITKLTARTRLVTALGLYLASSAIMLAWHPTSPVLGFIKQTLVGEAAPGQGFWTYHFPVVPWLALYLVGTSLGGRIAGYMLEADVSGAARWLARLGWIALLAGVALRAVALMLERKGLPGGAEMHAIFSFSRKLPPGPGYLLLFGGAALLFVRGALLLERDGRLPRLRETCAMLGRTSLFVFILQELVYVGGFSLLRLSYTPFWPLYLLASVTLIVSIARIWDERGLMRIMTVGLERKLERTAVPGGA